MLVTIFHSLPHGLGVGDWIRSLSLALSVKIHRPGVVLCRGLYSALSGKMQTNFIVIYLKGFQFVCDRPDLGGDLIGSIAVGGSCWQGAGLGITYG